MKIKTTDLKVGDVVYIRDVSSFRNSYRVGHVAKVTPTGMVDVFRGTAPAGQGQVPVRFNAEGREHGSKDRFRGSHLEVDNEVAERAIAAEKRAKVSSDAYRELHAFVLQGRPNHADIDKIIELAAAVKATLGEEAP